MFRDISPAILNGVVGSTGNKDTKNSLIASYDRGLLYKLIGPWEIWMEI